MALVQYQPIVITVHVNSMIKSFSSGVITDPAYVCSASAVTNDLNSLNLNHAVVVVGYNNKATIPYFIIRNSWGTGYG